MRSGRRGPLCRGRTATVHSPLAADSGRGQMVMAVLVAMAAWPSHAHGCAHAHGSDRHRRRPPDRIRLRLRRPVAVLRRTAGARDADEVGREPGGDGREDAGERPGNRQDRVREGIRQADGIDPGLGSGDEEGNGCARGRALAAQSEGGRDDAAGAERQRNPDRRGPEHRLHLAGAEEPGEQALGDEDGKRPGEQKAERAGRRTPPSGSPRFRAGPGAERRSCRALAESIDRKPISRDETRSNCDARLFADTRPFSG